ncbi:unnamed protein product [Vitrella brassicaformis CCMP3155]|uniref:PHD-type domain-containing protein n=1 Tax=Vitrella brassicaformis (strain CCMP3155) TaxID=1169540 RepID=A0A0G4H5G8_VITBC|nr:unnamed protein product [Vitrella brassicaformis CCMP3155]|eukprot:CEM39041.1 unnamed protein product [Vitrella brassicaformis CCMP3155]
MASSSSSSSPRCEISNAFRLVQFKEVLKERNKMPALKQALTPDSDTLKDTIQAVSRGAGSGSKEGGNKPHLFSSGLGGVSGTIHCRNQAALWDSAAHCVLEGGVDPRLAVVEIVDHRHPVRFATPLSEKCYSLVLNDTKHIDDRLPVVLGEYTGVVCKPQVDETGQENTTYVFRLEFDPRAVHGDKSRVASVRGDHGSVGGPRGRKQQLVLPHDDEWVVDASRFHNEMALVNHCEAIDLCANPNGFKNLHVNACWHQIYEDGWPHVVLCTIPGVRIYPGDEIVADFGRLWFDRVRELAIRGLRNELLTARLLRAEAQGIPAIPASSDADASDQDPFGETSPEHTLCGICQQPDPHPIGTSDQMRDEDDISIAGGPPLGATGSIVCDGCAFPFHLHCLGLEPNDTPPDDVEWFCPNCVALSERVADAVSGGNKNDPLSVRRLRRVHSAAYNADHRPGGCTLNMKQPLVQGGSRGVRGVASAHLSDDAFSMLKPCGACKKRKKGADPEGLHINCRDQTERDVAQNTIGALVRAYTNVRSRDGSARKGDKQRRQRQNKSTLQHKSLAAAAAADHRQASEVGGALGGGGEKWQAVEGWIPLLGICINKTAIERKFAMGAFEGRVEGVGERGYLDIKYSDGDDESVDAESLQKILRDWLQDNSMSAKTRKEIITSLMIDKQVIEKYMMRTVPVRLLGGGSTLHDDDSDFGDDDDRHSGNGSKGSSNKRSKPAHPSPSPPPFHEFSGTPSVPIVKGRSSQAPRKQAINRGRRERRGKDSRGAMEVDGERSPGSCVPSGNIDNLMGIE